MTIPPSTILRSTILGLTLSCGLSPLAAGRPALAQVQLPCGGTLLEARGTAEQKRPIQRLRLSLGLEAEAAGASEALALLQQRLAAVRSALQQLGVQELQVGSPSTWQRPAEGRRPARTQASLQVGGLLAPERLQSLIRQVGSLPGVRLAPVTPEADTNGDGTVRAHLLRQAYQDALRQGRELAEAIGLRQLRPLQVQVDGMARPMMRMAADVAAAPPAFDPAELPPPTDRLSLQVSFCGQ
ncbi:MAG: SIMPL domain-containing protein [Cyanobacteriota bacterium]|nr:SIMPL domain-containing protein [Cyanobacteriota bacterium]